MEESLEEWFTRAGHKSIGFLFELALLQTNKSFEQFFLRFFYIDISLLFNFKINH